MTQNQNQTVRNAESVENINSIPTFEEVYAMPYVQESIETVLDQNVRQYKLLAGYKDDLRQEILIHINNELTKFDPSKSSFNTFFRTSLHSAICNARKKYFRKSHLALYYAECVLSYENDDKDCNPESRYAYSRYTKNNVAIEMRRKDIEEFLLSLPNPLGSIAKKIYHGYSIRDIERQMRIPHATFARRYLAQLRCEFKKKFLKNNRKNADQIQKWI